MPRAKVVLQSPEEWRKVAVVAADIAFRISDHGMTEQARYDMEWDVSVYIDRCARAAELFIQSGGYDLDGMAEALDEIAEGIADGLDGWDTARMVLKRYPR